LKSHVLRPLWVVLAVVALVMAIRPMIVPSDFGIGERGFMYSFHRKSSEDDWKAFKVKYQTRQYCADCHEEKYESIMASKHKIIQCENCHGPALEHPEDPEKLVIDRSRKLCLRCHAYLPYPTSNRANIKGIIPSEHNEGEPCAECHDPHEPDL
jgi:predicted CXXCH cytochrome family protein